MKKLIFFVTTILSFVLILFSLTSCGEDRENNGSLLDSARSIKIVGMEGSATVSDDKEELKCFKGMNLYDGDTLNIGADSVLVIKFDEDKYVYLGENTTINIKSEGKDSYKTNIFVEKGIVLAEIQNKLGLEEEFFLSSNNSVMAVRGTVFGLHVREINNVLHQIYSVFKGVTELFVFDKINNELVKGKLTDISNKKIEVKINKDKIIKKEEFNQITDNWLDGIDNKYQDENDANDKLDEVEITVSTPSEEDYKKVIDTISEETKVTYSSLTYSSKGYFDYYDGNPHKISVNVDNKDAKVYYRSENMSTYSETNNFEYTEPGIYRVYYKIVCDGYDDKEDFEVINIYKKNIIVSLKSELNLYPISGMTLEESLSGINLKDYIELSGIAEEDKQYLDDIGFSYDGRVSSDIDSYEIKLILPDNIKDYYDEPTFNININSRKLVYNTPYVSSDIFDGNVLMLNGMMTFNKYNGIKANTLFDSMEFQIGGNNPVTEFEPNNISFEYEHTMDGYIDLKNGINTFTATFTFDDYDIVDEFTFTFNDYRLSNGIKFGNLTNVTNLGDNDYFYDITGSAASNIVSIATLLERFGLEDNSILVNYPKDYLDDSINQYNSNGTLAIIEDEFMEITFTRFPDSERLLSEKKVRIIFSTEVPVGYPEFLIRSDEYTFKYDEDGILMNFVDTTENVLYSIDGVNYSSELVLTEVGEYTVYYKVGSTVVVEGSRKVTIALSTITSSNLDMISPVISIISNDGNELYLEGESTGLTYEVESSDGTTITSLDEVYTIYTNLLKNAKYLDSISHTLLEDVNVEVSEKVAGSANFTYKISKTGYETIEGSVEFVYAKFGDAGTTSGSITNPIDLNLEYDSEGYNPSRIMTSFEEDSDFNYSVLYSVDNGNNWSSDEPTLTNVGTYNIYCLYNLTNMRVNTGSGKIGDCLLSPYGNYIVSIQTVTIYN